MSADKIFQINKRHDFLLKMERKLAKKYGDQRDLTRYLVGSYKTREGK